MSRDTEGQNGAGYMDVDVSIETLDEMAKELKKSNDELVAWISQQNVNGNTVTLNGVGEARHELFFDFLTEIGMIPEEVRALFEVRWAKRFQENLIKTKNEIVEAQQLAHREQIRQTLLGGNMAARPPTGPSMRLPTRIKDNPQA